MAETLPSGSGGGLPPGGGPFGNGPPDKASPPQEPPKKRKQQRATSEDEGSDPREGETRQEYLNRQGRFKRYKRRKLLAAGENAVYEELRGKFRPTPIKDKINPDHPDYDPIAHRAFKDNAAERNRKYNRAKRGIPPENIRRPGRPVESVPPNTRCSNCQMYHARCDNETPCGHCTRRGAQCIRPQAVQVALQAQSQPVPSQVQSQQQQYPQAKDSQQLAVHVKSRNLSSGDIEFGMMIRQYLAEDAEVEEDRSEEQAQRMWEAAIDPELYNTSAGDTSKSNAPGFRAFARESLLLRPARAAVQELPPDGYPRFTQPLLADMPRLEAGMTVVPGGQVDTDVANSTCDERHGPFWMNQICGRQPARPCQSREHFPRPHHVCNECDEIMKADLGPENNNYYSQEHVRLAMCNQCARLFQDPRHRVPRGVRMAGPCQCQTKLQDYRYCAHHWMIAGPALFLRAERIRGELAGNSNVGFDGAGGCPFCPEQNENNFNDVNFQHNTQLCLGCDEIMILNTQ